MYVYILGNGVLDESIVIIPGVLGPLSSNSDHWITPIRKDVLCFMAISYCGREDR